MCMSCSGDPPWILKRDGQRLIYSIGKTKRIAFFFFFCNYFFLLSGFFKDFFFFFIFLVVLTCFDIFQFFGGGVLVVEVAVTAFGRVAVVIVVGAL